MLTNAQRKALKIIRDKGPIRPREFAREMWPDSPGWRHHSKCGPYGSTAAGGMNLAGGAYLGKIRRLGWIQLEISYLGWPEGYILTQAGRRALESDENAVVG